MIFFGGRKEAIAFGKRIYRQQRISKEGGCGFDRRVRLTLYRKLSFSFIMRGELFSRKSIELRRWWERDLPFFSFEEKLLRWFERDVGHKVLPSARNREAFRKNEAPNGGWRNRGKEYPTFFSSPSNNNTTLAVYFLFLISLGERINDRVSRRSLGGRIVWFRAHLGNNPTGRNTWYHSKSLPPFLREDKDCRVAAERRGSFLPFEPPTRGRGS